MPVVATAGHVDHGKSALVRALTGTDPDRLPQERSRGLTLDLGFAWTDLEGERFDIVDVPGHQRYVETMVAGVGVGLPVMFVVAADEGWRAQSTEHAELVAALGCPSVLLVVTRADLADPGPATREATARLAGVGLSPYAPVAVSAVTGVGLAALRQTLRAWSAGFPKPSPDAPVRLWVDRRFSVAGAGTVVTGTLTAGTLGVGDHVEVAGHVTTIRGLHRNDEAVARVTAPARVALALRGLGREDVRRGDVVTMPRAGATVSQAVLAPAPDPAALPRTAGVSRQAGAPRQAGLARTAGLPRQATAHVGTAAIPVWLHARPDGCIRLIVRGTDKAPFAVGDQVLLRDPGAHRVLTVGRLIEVGAPPPASRHRAAPGRSTTRPAGLDRLRDWFAEHPREAPTADQLLGWGLAPRDLAVAEAGGEVLRLGGVVVRPGLLREAATALTHLTPAFTAGDACRALGVSRRIGIPLLERLDATHVTIRHPDGTRSLRR